MEGFKTLLLANWPHIIIVRARKVYFIQDDREEGIADTCSTKAMSQRAKEAFKRNWKFQIKG